MLHNFSFVKSLATVVALCAAFGASSAMSAYAADNVTVMLRGGDRVSGQLEDLARGTVYVRVSINDQRRIPLADVALIDFVGGASGLPETELSQARGDEHLLVLRNSSLVKGQLVDIEGGEGSDKPDEPRIFVFRAAGGDQRRVPVGEVGRVYLGRFPTVAPQTGLTMPEGATGVRVPANQPWTSTGITVVEGQIVQLTTQGEVQLSTAGDDRATAAGSASGRRAPAAPLPGTLAGALIGRVGTNGAPFGIGNQTSIPMPGSGLLYLGINDDQVGDNTGGFVVDVKPQPVAQRRRR